MDPSIAFGQHEGHGGGQERRVRGGGGGYGRDATATGGAAASSSSEWRTPTVDVGSFHQGGEGSTEPVPAAAGEAAPCVAADVHVSSDGAGAPPPPASTVASSGTMMATGRGRLQGAVWTPPLRPGQGTAATARGLRWTSRGLLGGTSDKWVGLPGPYISRHGSPRPVVPSHCEGGTTTATGGARPDGSLGGIGDEGPGQGHEDAATHHASGAHDELVSLSPSGAPCADGGAASSVQHSLPDVNRGAGAFPGGDDVGHRDDALRAKVETEARPSPTGPDVTAVGEAAVGAFPVPSDAGCGEAPGGVIGGLPLEGALGEADDLPSFSPVGGEPPGPSEPEEAVHGETAVRDSVCEGVAAHGRAPHLPAGADAGQDGGGQVDGARSSGAGADGSPSRSRAAGASALPHGVVSPPAVKSFSGGLLDPTSGAGGNANIAHSVPLDSDSDSGLGGSESAAVAADGVAAAYGLGGGSSPPGLAGARQ